MVGVVRSFQNFGFKCHIHHSIASLERFGRRSSDFGRDFGRRSIDFGRFSGFETSAARSGRSFGGFAKRFRAPGPSGVWCDAGALRPPHPQHKRGAARKRRGKTARRAGRHRKTPRLTILRLPDLARYGAGAAFRSRENSGPPCTRGRCAPLHPQPRRRLGAHSAAPAARRATRCRKRGQVRFSRSRT